MENHSEKKLHVGKFQPSKLISSLTLAFIVVGLVGFVFGLLKNPNGLWPAYLTAFFYATSIAMGAMFFVSINNLTNAGWSVTIRRIAEGMTAFIPAITIAGLVLAILGLKHLYPWARPEEVAASPVIAAKAGFLNANAVIVRILIFGLGSWFLAHLAVGNSLKQDQTGEDSLTAKNVKVAIAFILFFALSFSLFSVDMLMSLLPTWYSTIFGIYCFAGAFQASLAFLILVLIYLKRRGFVEGYYNVEHIHDVAKYLKGFTVFWAYIAFSQFMLIWYANIPEETEFYLMRSQNGWMMISMGLLIFRFIVPFLALLPRAAKRTENHLIMVCTLVLVMQYVDIFWMVGPNFNDNQMHIGVFEITQMMGFLGLFVWLMFRFFARHSLVALKDPRINEALSHHVTY